MGATPHCGLSENWKMSNLFEILKEREFVVIDVVATDPPEGITGGNWFRYTIGHGSSPITGIRSGSLKSVRRHAEEFAENLNQRALHGYSAYVTRRSRNK